MKLCSLGAMNTVLARVGLLFVVTVDDDKKTTFHLETVETWRRRGSWSDTGRWGVYVMAPERDGWTLVADGRGRLHLYDEKPKAITVAHTLQREVQPDYRVEARAYVEGDEKRRYYTANQG